MHTKLTNNLKKTVGTFLSKRPQKYFPLKLKTYVFTSGSIPLSKCHVRGVNVLNNSNFKLNKRSVKKQLFDVNLKNV